VGTVINKRDDWNKSTLHFLTISDHSSNVLSITTITITMVHVWKGKKGSITINGPMVLLIEIQKSHKRRKDEASRPISSYLYHYMRSSTGKVSVKIQPFKFVSTKSHPLPPHLPSRRPPPHQHPQGLHRRRDLKLDVWPGTQALALARCD
jgi:hypothetical protein